MLFIKHTGSFEDNDLVITCEDIYPMDLGTSGWTEFKMSEDVAAYMAENIELFDCDTALCHSHHTMGAFFSGQDNLMLQQEGNDTNCFISLVVDTQGTYVARVTRKVITKSEVTVKNLGTSYEFFGEGNRELTNAGTETTKVIEKEVIEYFDLEVERHEVSNNLEYLDVRFEEIEKKKTRASKPAGWTAWDYKKDAPMQYQKGTKEPKEQDLFECKDDKENITPEDEEKLTEVVMGWQPDSKKIHKAVVQMVTCSLILNPDKIDFKQWVKKHMVNMYGNIFGEECLAMAQDQSPYSNPFTDYKEFMVEFMVSNYTSSDIPDIVLGNDDFLWSRVATAMYNELMAYKEDNAFIGEYLESLTNYMIE